MDSNSPRLLSGTRNILRLVVLLVAPAVPVVSGQESVLTLAMLRYDQPAVRTLAVVCYDSATISFSHVSVPVLQYQVAASRYDSPGASAFSFDTLLEEQNRYYRQEWLQLFHKGLVGDGRTSFWGHLEAGYGQFWRLESQFGKSAMELEQPSCAYLMARFSF